MKKTKIKQRLENAFDAFFNDENLIKEDSLIFANGRNPSHNDSTKSFSDKADIFVKILKQVFLFFPGAFVIFNLIFIITATSLNTPGYTFIILTRKAVTYLLVSTFMTILGLGDIKNIKHLIIPASIAFFAFLSGVIVSLSTNDLRILDTYAMYLLPFALMIPILAKGWIDKTEEI